MHQPEPGRLSRLDSHTVSSLHTPTTDGDKALTHAVPSGTETSSESLCKGGWRVQLSAAVGQSLPPILSASHQNGTLLEMCSGCVIWGR